MKKILRLILAPILGPIKIVLTLAILVGGAYWTHQQGMWSAAGMLTPDWLKAGPDAASYVDLENLVIEAITADAVLVAGNMQVADTLSTYIQRDFATDYSAAFAFLSEVDLCVSTADVQARIENDTMVITFSTSELCKPRVIEEKTLSYDALRHIFIPETELEKYRQQEKERALQRLMTMLSQADLVFFAKKCEPSLAKLIGSILGAVWRSQGVPPMSVKVVINPPLASTT